MKEENCKRCLILASLSTIITIEFTFLYPPQVKLPKERQAYNASQSLLVLLQLLPLATCLSPTELTVRLDRSQSLDMMVIVKRRRSRSTHQNFCRGIMSDVVVVVVVVLSVE